MHKVPWMMISQKQRLKKMQKIALFTVTVLSGKKHFLGPEEVRKYLNFRELHLSLDVGREISIFSEKSLCYCMPPSALLL
jgi:hypothetical protein